MVVRYIGDGDIIEIAKNKAPRYIKVGDLEQRRHCEVPHPLGDAAISREVDSPVIASGAKQSRGC